MVCKKIFRIIIWYINNIYNYTLLFIMPRILNIILIKKYNCDDNKTNNIKIKYVQN